MKYKITMVIETESKCEVGDEDVYCAIKEKNRDSDYEMEATE